MLGAAKILFSKFAWQIGASAAAVALLVTSGFLIAAQVENHRVAELNRALDDRISNPSTGYVVKLAQAQTNTIQVKTALERQVADLRAKAAADAARLAATEARLQAAQRETAKARRDAAAMLARPPQGDTLEQRVLDVDGRLLEQLK